MSASRSPGSESAPVPLRTIALLATAAFASSVNIRSSDALLPQIAESYGETIGAAAGIITAFTIGYGLTQLLFGPIGDRVGKFLIVALTTMVAGLATFLAAFVPTLGALTVTRFAAGAFAAAAIPLAFAWIGDAVPFERRQAVLARFLSAQMTGMILSPAIGGLLGDIVGWQSVYLIVGAVHVMAGIAMLIELKRHPLAQPPPTPTTPGAGRVAAQMLSIATGPWVRIMLVAVFVEALAMYGALAYVSADLRLRLGLSYSAVGALMAVYGIGAIVYSLTARHLLARLGERGLVVSGGVLMGAAFAGLALGPKVAFIPPLMLLLGLAFYMMHNTLQTNATQMAPEARGVGVSIFAFALFAGQSIGVAAAAPLVDRWGSAPVFAVAAVLLPLTAVWFAGALRHRPT